jgi:acyl-coenzyme A synthetase/AMP-(fatty) acid ligase
MLAVHRLGARAAVLDPAAGPDVLRARLALARPCVVLADATAQVVAGWARPIAHHARLALPDLAELGPVATVGPRLPGCAPTLDANVRMVPLPPPVDEDGDAVIVFTSGTTSQSAQ